MNIFKKIIDFFVRIWNAIWNWIKDLFKKKPLVRITIMSLIVLFLFPIQTMAQRPALSNIIVVFNQPDITTTDYWTIQWNTDSDDVYKTDTSRVKIKNNQGQWVNWVDLSSTLDTMVVNIKFDNPYSYDQEFTFSVVAKDLSGGSAESDEIDTYFIVSDINKVNNSDVIRGFRWGDKSVDGLDLLELSRNWGKTGVTYDQYYDITGDGNVDGLDLLQLSRDWGRTWYPLQIDLLLKFLPMFGKVI